MPALLPIVLTASYLVLAADRVPEFNVEPGCRAAIAAAVAPNRDVSACKRDELDRPRQAQAGLGEVYARANRRAACRLSKLGGFPSYVELLTCLEMAKDAGKPCRRTTS